MYNIKNDIKNKAYKNVYILCGEEEFLSEFYMNEIISDVTDSDTREFNLMKISNFFPDETEIDTFANSYPFMSDKKVLAIEDTGIFKKSSESTKAFLSSLISAIPEYLIILFAENEIDKRNALYKQISKAYPVCEFEFLDTPSLSSWITKIFKASAKDISPEDALHICQIAGPSMLSLKSEAEKLISFASNTNVIDRKTIDSLVTRNIENRVFDMIDDIAAGKNADALKKLSDLRALNEEPVKIINIIFGKFCTFHKLLVLKNKSIREICSICGLYEKHARNNLAQASKLGEARIARVMLKCRDMDFAVKNGSMDKWLATETIIMTALSD